MSSTSKTFEKLMKSIHKDFINIDKKIKRSLNYSQSDILSAQKYSRLYRSAILYLENNRVGTIRTDYSQDDLSKHLDNLYRKILDGYKKMKKSRKFPQFSSGSLGAYFWYVIFKKITIASINEVLRLNGHDHSYIANTFVKLQSNAMKTGKNIEGNQLLTQQAQFYVLKNFLLKLKF